MGTSGAFKGSGGKAAGDLRGAIADWLSDDSSSSDVGQNDETGNQDGASNDAQTDQPRMNPSVIAPIIGMWGSGSRSSGGGSPGGGASGGGNSRNTNAGRSSGGVRRSVSRVAGPAGRASALARAYSTGDREALEAAGLNYDDLRALNDPLMIGKRISEVVYETQANSTVEDSEARMIVAELASWILESPDDQPPEPDDIVRHSIELMIAQSALVEVGDTIRQEKSQAKRLEVEKDIRLSAKVYASRITLRGTGTSASEITRAIKNGVTQLINIYKESL